MKKNDFLLITIFLMGNICYSQAKRTDSSNVISSEVEQFQVDKAILTPKANSTSKPTAVYEKFPLPKNQKVSPEIFYVIDDKAVDYSTYMHSSRSTTDKK